ncbi:MAG: hypothetical protein AN484_06425 [Aphanizomenon flos-aquae WA102]|uniref:Uncharacterized protein n=1 Tax=Aphanizomenon flos-aquae WA102 TaxID=1710896 RepID=A0A1B7X582_APHFL|nr:MAG: hypothetical protein AN484_06425 [Aphanizomenon flos-aquae WA102]
MRGIKNLKGLSQAEQPPFHQMKDTQYYNAMSYAAAVAAMIGTAGAYDVPVPCNEAVPFRTRVLSVETPRRNVEASDVMVYEMYKDLFSRRQEPIEIKVEVIK